MTHEHEEPQKWEKNPDLNIEGTVSQNVSNALWKTTKNSINMNLQNI